MSSDSTKKIQHDHNDFCAILGRLGDLHAQSVAEVQRLEAENRTLRQDICTSGTMSFEDELAEQSASLHTFRLKHDEKADGARKMGLAIRQFESQLQDRRSRDNDFSSESEHIVTSSYGDLNLHLSRLAATIQIKSQLVNRMSTLSSELCTTRKQAGVMESMIEKEHDTIESLETLIHNILQVPLAGDNL